ncbi:MAG: hypothetical protein IPL74_11915 [Bacteroidetes bacterium]|nr:hypothetical protein [Bacteroidota bacterium]
MANFYHNPVVASVALLTKFQADVRDVESEIVNHLLHRYLKCFQL